MAIRLSDKIVTQILTDLNENKISADTALHRLNQIFNGEDKTIEPTREKNIISNVLLESKRFLIGIFTLHKYKPRQFVFSKAAEELNELAVKLLQLSNNPSSNKVTDEEILEEIVDVQMNLLLLIKYHRNERQIEKTTERKIEKFLASADVRHYSQFLRPGDYEQ